LTNALKFVVKYETLGLEESFQGICFKSWFFQSMPICHNWWQSL
jgi:hypothetical protein